MLFSVIIPVYGQWLLTKNCLLSLRKEIKLPFEVILVDNGAKVLEDDETRNEAPSLGKELFGDNFVYLPQEKNLNFAGASNLGAREARSELLFFLNNDTVVLPNFLMPLLEEFSDSTQKLMIAPMLVYPPKSADDDILIQHIGVYYTPLKKVAHLYELFPYNHRVTRTQRNLQCITAAAVMMRKKDFFDVGAFDEEFVNCFEDVELCARFKRAGGIMKVVPQSIVVHFCSQTRDNNDTSLYNSQILLKKVSRESIVPDYHLLLEQDGYELHLDEWLKFIPHLNVEYKQALQKIIQRNDYEEIKSQLMKEPYWYDGLYALANHEKTNLNEKIKLFANATNKDLNIPLYYEFAKLAVQSDIKNLPQLTNALELLEKTVENRLNQFENLKKMTSSVSQILHSECKRYMENNNNFMQNTFTPMHNELTRLIRHYKPLYEQTKHESNYEN